MCPARAPTDAHQAPLLTPQGWRVAYWVVAATGFLTAAVAWLAIVEPRARLRKPAPPPGATPPPRRAVLAVVRAEALRILRDFWTVLKIPTFVVMMAEVRPMPHGMHLQMPSTALHGLAQLLLVLNRAGAVRPTERVSRPGVMQTVHLRSGCCAQHVVGSFSWSSGYRTMYFQVRPIS